MKNKQGMVYVFAGTGKGKTSAALGVAVRSLCLLKKVVWVSWFKHSDWDIAEMKMPKYFKKNLEMYWMGKGFYGGPMDIDTPEGHKKAAKEALLFVSNLLDKNEGDGGMKIDLLVLDEVIRAVNDELLTVKEVMEIVKKRGKTNVVLTGHVCPSEIENMADLVTEMKKIKHPYDKGIMAVPGLDF